MMIEIFTPSLPSIVTASFAGTRLMISVFNMIGRIFGLLCLTTLEEKQHILFSLL